MWQSGRNGKPWEREAGLEVEFERRKSCIASVRRLLHIVCRGRTLVNRRIAWCSDAHEIIRLDGRSFRKPDVIYDQGSAKP